MLPWDIEPAEVLAAGDVVLEISGTDNPRMNVKADDGFALSLLSLALSRAGVRVSDVQRIEPVFGADDFMLAAERAIDFDPLEPELIDRCIEVLRA